MIQREYLKQALCTWDPYWIPFGYLPIR